MERTQFTFYESYYLASARMRKKSDRADLYDAICRLALLGEEPDLDSLSDIVATALTAIMPNIIAGNKKAENGKKGGEKSEQTESKTEANGKQIASEIESKKENKIKNKKENKCLFKEKKRESPTAEEYGEVRRLLEEL